MPNWEYAGIKKIMIPLSAEEITVEAIKKWMPHVLTVHERNAKKIEYYQKYVDGLFQPIDDKMRSSTKSSERNNRIKQNNAFFMVSFKEGFMLGDKREFAPKSDEESGEMIYFDRFLTDASFYSKDLSVKHNLYTSGIGTSFIMPRSDIFYSDGNFTRLKTAGEGYDADNDSPFVYESLDGTKNAVVYTSQIGAKGLGDLFCFNISQFQDNYGISNSLYTVYTRDFIVQLDSDMNIVGDIIPTSPSYREIPMVEHSINDRRIGIVEITESMLDGINTLTSNCVDNVVDVANKIVVFLGCKAEGVDVDSMYENGAICIPPTNGMSVPSVDTFDVGMNYSDVNVLIHEIMTRCYDIVGIPLTGSVSGNGNNQAAYVGGGWTNAMTVIKRDIRALESSDRELLKKMLAICKLNPDNKLKNIHANQIDIKYNIKITDDVFSYSQALQNLFDCDVPLEHILSAIPLWGDIKTVAADWGRNIEKAKEEEKENANLESNDNQIESSDDVDI